MFLSYEVLDMIGGFIGSWIDLYMVDFIVLVIGFSILKEDDLSYSALLLDDFQSYGLFFLDIQIFCFPPCLGNFLFFSEFSFQVSFCRILIRWGAILSIDHYCACTRIS
jgi:hypothetical protein